MSGRVIVMSEAKPRKRGKSPKNNPLVIEQRKLILAEAAKALEAHSAATTAEIGNIAGAYYQGLVRALELNDVAAEVLAGRVIL